jgi:mannitol/fructose-specific phosphotransferase system IIA component (Ntr-type)
LNENLVVRKNFASAREMRDALVDAIFRENNLQVSRDAVDKALDERSGLGNLALGSGLAAPHARLVSMDDMFMAVGLSDMSVSLEGKPVKMMVLFLTSQSKSTLYLNALSAFAKMAQEEDYWKSLVNSQPRDFLELLKQKDVEISRTITVSSIMTYTVLSIRPEATLREAADMFYEHRMSYLPVIDAAGNFVGEVTVLDLFGSGIPDYAMKMGSLSFLGSFEPFEDLLENENSRKVSDIMKPPRLNLLHPETPVVESVLKFVQTHCRDIPVVENGKLAGVLSYMDVLHKVLRA